MTQVALKKAKPSKKLGFAVKEFTLNINNSGKIEIPADIKESLQLKPNDLINVCIQKIDDEDFQVMLKQLKHDGILISAEND